MEIERKFLVADLPKLAELDSEPIEQGYLALGTEGEVRLRRKSEELLLTVKRGEGLSREEQEIELQPEQFDALWPLTEGRRLRKRRYTLAVEGAELELDLFEGELEGVALAEVEFADEEVARAFDPPGWLGREVTGDPAFLNENLATRPPHV